MSQLSVGFAVAMFCACTSCGVFSGSAAEPMAAPEMAASAGAVPSQPAQSGDTPAAAPGGETAITSAANGPYAHLPPRESFVPTANAELEAGCYQGDFVLDQPRLKVRGAGMHETVIDGDLIVGSRCVVTNMTVTGDLIFTGNGARAVGVRCLGQVLDYGLQNQH